MVFGGAPSSSRSPASPPIATIVPIVSKKSASMIEKTSRTTATRPILPIDPNSEKCPSSEKSGALMIPPSGIAGSLSFHASGALPSVGWEPSLATASMITASTVEVMIEIISAPRTLRVISTIASSSPITKTSSGHPANDPLMPSSTGVARLAGIRTNPASTKPMKAMNRPMPTLIAVLSSIGTALNTAVRNPVSTSTRMIRPSSTTMPIASGHVMPGRAAME